VSHGEKRVRARRLRVGIVAGTLSLLTLAGALVATAPASATPGRGAATPVPTPTPTLTAPPKPHPVGTALVAQLAPGAMLTLPAGDGLRDRTTVRVFSGKGGLVDVDAVQGKKTVVIASRVALRSTRTGWQRTVTVPVKAKGLKAGRWRIRAQRSTDHGIQARSTLFLIGSGAAVHVGVTPAARTLYPFKDGTLDTELVTVTAKDETGAPVPATGTVRIDAGKKHVVKRLGAAGTATLPITALPLGAATITATVAGSSGAKAVRFAGVTLAPTGIGTSRMTRSSDTVQPVVDGLLDSVVLTTTGTASAGSTATVSGLLTITSGRTVAASWVVPDGAQHAFTWNGRVAGKVVPGTYTVTLSLRGPQGLVKTRTTTLVVLSSHLPYREQDLFTVAAGNQQGLAVHDGTFYVGYDNGDGTSRIELYNGSGAQIGTWGPMAIGHAAELSYSTATGLLYAANGGPTSPTTVWSIDPATGAVRDTFDLSSLGPNGMVAVDDVNRRLLVFTGTAGAYSITPVSLDAIPATDTTAEVPAGTPGRSVPIAITGMPQGLEVVGSQLWVYTSVKKFNHLAQFDLARLLPAADPAAADPATSGDLVFPGEGEGMAYQAPADGQTSGTGLPGWMYVGAHTANRIGLLFAVADE
jgi:hypothetical protein